ncbi:hypothetical protein [Olsenella uli]|nr:hypothetical protein [Olsenella uli]
MRPEREVPENAKAFIIQEVVRTYPWANVGKLRSKVTPERGL